MVFQSSISFLILFGLNFFECTSQISLSGKVVDHETGEPIAGASVYFNNTSIGTTSNQNGEFSLNAANLVNTELIVSSIGYELLAARVVGGPAHRVKYQVRLQVKEEQLREVLIVPDITRRKWLDAFQRNFLGITAEADRSKILNLGDLYFTRGKDAHTFNAYSDTPLIITNKMLGYNVQFQLAEFSYDEQTGRTSFYGYTRYNEMGDQKRWARNRKKTYGEVRSTFTGR